LWQNKDIYWNEWLLYKYQVVIRKSRIDYKIVLPVKKEDKLSTKTKPIEIKYIIIGKTPKSMPCSPRRLKSVLIQTKDIIGKTDDKSLDGITELIGVTWLHKIR
jgi:hypothetical protein